MWSLFRVKGRVLEAFECCIVTLVLPMGMTFFQCTAKNTLIFFVVIVAACGVPSAPTNGSVRSYSSVVLGGTVTYDCDVGFQPSTQFATCVLSRKWEPKPICSKPGEQSLHWWHPHTQAGDISHSTIGDILWLCPLWPHLNRNSLYVRWLVSAASPVI